MTLLSIVQNVAVSLSLGEPSSIVTSTDPAIRKLLRFANQAGKQLAKYHDWQDLVVEQTFSTLAQRVQTNALPPVDYDRLLYRPVIWDRTENRKLIGPTDQKTWARLQTGVGLGGTYYWRLLGSQLNVIPNPSAGHTLGFEYVSKRWVLSSVGDPQETFTDDTDTCRVPVFEDLLELELVWRFQQSTGFAQYAENMKTCEKEKELAAAADRGSGEVGEDKTDVVNYPYIVGA
jgi:hypothetical protein